MGYLPEERGLYKKMEVGEQALYLARLKGLSRADAMKRLKYWFEKVRDTGLVEKESRGTLERDGPEGAVHHHRIARAELPHPRREPFTGLIPSMPNWSRTSCWS